MDVEGRVGAGHLQIPSTKVAGRITETVCSFRLFLATAYPFMQVFLQALACLGVTVRYENIGERLMDVLR